MSSDISDLTDFSTQCQQSAAVLVQCAISHRDTFDLSLFADLITVHKAPRDADKPIDQEQKAGHCKRGAVTQFSRRSRKRMLEKLAKLRDASGGYFVTLLSLIHI